MTAITLGYRVIQSKIQSVSLFQLNWKIVYILGISLCALLFVFYVFSINQLTDEVYQIGSYNKQISSLTKENKIIEANFAEIGILNQVHNRASELGFVRTQNVKYIELSSTSLAKAN